MAFCTKCGNELREGNAFCTKCGARVVVPDAATEEEPLNPEEEVAGSAAEKFGHPSNSDYEELPESRPTPDRGEAEPDPTVEELKKMAGEAKDYINRAANRVKATVEETKASYRAAESGEDAQSDPISDQLSGAILGAAKWFSKIGEKPKTLSTSLSATRLDKNASLAICAVGALLLILCFGMLSCLGSPATSSNSSMSSKTPATSEASEKAYTTHIKVKCNKNWFFSTYDVQIYIDDSLVATLDHGDEGSWDKALTKGSHQIKVCEKGNESIDGSKTFEVKAESVLECTVSTTSTQVEFKEFSCQTREEIEKAEAEAEKKSQEEAQTKLEAQQYVSDGTGKTYKAHFSVSGWINTLFLKARSINIYLDGSQVKAVADGETTEWEQDLGSGKHTLRFASAEDDSVDVMQAFTLSDEGYLSCKASLGVSGVEVEDYSFETQAERAKAAEEAQQKAAAEAEAKAKQEAAEAEAKAKREAEAAEKAKVLTVDNCEDLANMLTSSSSDASAFAAAYSGRTIEFDGNIAYMASHNGAKTRFDVLIYAGDYSETSAKGPNMQYKDVNYRDMGASGIDSVQMGLNVRIRAKVGSYNSSTDILSLTPVSMTAR